MPGFFYFHIMKKFVFLWIVLFAVSCNNDKSESTSEGAAEATEEAQERVLEDCPECAVEEEEWDDPYYDTVYYEKLDSRFYYPQLDNNVQFLYWIPELKVYDDWYLTNEIFTIPKGAKVKIDSKININDTINGFDGQSCKIIYEGKVGYCNDAFFFKFPPPDNEDHDLVQYCLNNLHLTKEVKHEDRKSRNEYAEEGANRSATYHFEGGIELRTEEAWEYSGDFLFIPREYPEEVFLFMCALWSWNDMYALTNGIFPKDGVTELPSEYEHEENTVTVDRNHQLFVHKIGYHFGEGCASWCEVKWEDNGTTLHFGGGC